MGQMTHDKTISGKKVRLHNRRVFLGCDEDTWYIQFTRLGESPDEPRIVHTRLAVSDEAMAALSALYDCLCEPRRSIDAIRKILKSSHWQQVNGTYELEENQND